MKKLISDITYIKSDTKDIISVLQSKHGPVIRWAVVEVKDDLYKISFTYEIDN